MAATRSIPIVFPTSGDPVAQGFARSMARPGGNATGLWNMNSEIYVKRFELISEVLPGISRIALLGHDDSPSTVQTLKTLRSAGKQVALRAEAFDVRQPADLPKAFANMAGQKMQGILVATDSLLENNLVEVGELALKYKLPAIGPLMEVGVLAAYARDNPAMYRRAASYVDRIFKGANPGDLAIERPPKFVLTVNLQTARALGLTIPTPLLLRADRVIQ
jgi:putative ABC transport system substrate-binding protein